MEGTRQTVLILNAHIKAADKVYRLIGDSSCHEFNLISIDIKSNLEKYFHKNNVAIVIICASDLVVFQEGYQRIADYNMSLPLLCVSPAPIPQLQDFLREQDLVDPLVISRLTECNLLKYFLCN